MLTANYNKRGRKKSITKVILIFFLQRCVYVFAITNTYTLYVLYVFGLRPFLTPECTYLTDDSR